MVGHPPKKLHQNYATEDGDLPNEGTNPKYDPKGTLGSYRTSDEQTPFAEGTRLFEGFGANAEDLERGYCEPGIEDLPDYDKVNYQERWTEPSQPSEGPGNTLGMSKDYEFRMRERQSRGFLTRPRIPTERN